MSSQSRNLKEQVKPTQIYEIKLNENNQGLIQENQIKASIAPQSVRNEQIPQQIIAKYENQRILIPNQVIALKISPELSKLVEKSLPNLKLINDNQKWYLLPSGNYAKKIKSSNQQEYNSKKLYLLDNKIYFGHSLNNKPQGQGVFITEYSIYKGNFQNGQSQGYGQFQNNNFSLKGYWKNGFIENGTLKTKNFIYIGDFNYNKFEGKGVYKNQEQKISYTGQFKNGVFSGIGEYKCQKYIYKGHFKNGYKNGEGTIKISEQEQKQGFWQNDRLIS